MNKWSLGQSLQHFRLQVRRLVKVLCPVTQHRCLAGRARGQPLLHLGITTHLVTLPITIPLTPAAEHELAIRIIQSQASCSHKVATLKLQQKQWVVQHRLRTRGRVKWLASLRSWPDDLFQPGTASDVPTTTHQTNLDSEVTNTNNTTTTTTPTPTTQVRLPDIILLHCPTCKHAVDGTKDKFDMNKLNNRTWCKACHRQKFVRLWQCRCGIPWHTCPAHQGDPARLRKAKNANSYC